MADGLYFYSRRKLKLQLDLQRMRSEKEILKEKHIHLKKDVQTDRKLRAESAHDVSEVIRQINEIADSPKDKFQEDSWEIVFNTIDKLHPEFRQRLLSFNQSLENKDLIFIYLMKLGYKQADIARITKRARSVISRKYHRIEGLIGLPLVDAIKSEQLVVNQKLEDDIYQKHSENNAVEQNIQPVN